jgi:hypothetical protein
VKTAVDALSGSLGTIESTRRMTGASSPPVLRPRGQIAGVRTISGDGSRWRCSADRFSCSAADALVGLHVKRGKPAPAFSRPRVILNPSAF